MEGGGVGGWDKGRWRWLLGGYEREDDEWQNSKEGCMVGGYCMRDSVSDERRTNLSLSHMLNINLLHLFELTSSSS